MNILFLDQKEPVEGKAVKQDDSHILIEGVEKNTSGFRLLTEKGCVFGKYEEFTTLYKEEENGFILYRTFRQLEASSWVRCRQ